MTPTYPPTFIPPRNLNAPRYETHDSSQVKVHEVEFVTLESGQWFLRGENFVEKEFPVDFYLREMCDLPNTFDDDAVVEFVKTWGIFADVMERDIPAFLNLANHLGTNVWGNEINSWNEEDYDNLEEARRAAISELGLIKDWDKLNEHERGSAWYETQRRVVNLAEIKLRIIYMSNFNYFRSWLATNEPMEEFSSDALLKINAALSCFAPHLVVDSDLYGVYEPTIYNLAALQLAVDIRDNVQIRICQNERCGREFTRQRGGSKFGEYRLRGEVKYCSTKCLKAQNMRDSRNAKKAQALLATAGSKNDPELREQPEV